MRSLLLPALMVAVFGAGCATTDIKGRETLRLGPLRDAQVAPATVAPPLRLDVGTDAATDEEVAALYGALSTALSASLERLSNEHGAARIGDAEIILCRLRAGAGRTHTVYEAACRVRVMVAGEPVIEVHAEAVRRARARAISQQEADAIKKMVRNPLLVAADSRAALEAALDAAAQLVVTGRLPPRDNDGPQLTRAEKAALARDRLQRAVVARAAAPPATAPPSSAAPAEGSRVIGVDPNAANDDDSAPSSAPHDPLLTALMNARHENVRVAIFDLGETGLPRDAKLIEPFMDDADPKVLLAAIDALGLLCAPSSRPKLESLAHGGRADRSDAVMGAIARARARLTVCESLEGSTGVEGP